MGPCAGKLERIQRSQFTCPLCDRLGVKRSRHHLVPVAKGGKKGEVADICVLCHRTIHGLFSNKTLRDELNSIEAIRSDERFAAALDFIRKQAPRSYPRMRMAAKHRR